MSDPAGAAADTSPAPTSTAKPPALVDAGVGAIDTYLAALRQHESGNDYTARSSISTASGAYQYIDSTWANFAGYARAHLAPPAVQDARARSDALRAFTIYGNWEQVAAAHFYPAWAGDRSMWYRVPAPGNPTVQAYVDRVIRLMGLTTNALLSPTDTAAGSTGTTEATATMDVLTEAAGTGFEAEGTAGARLGGRDTVRTVGKLVADSLESESLETPRLSTRHSAGGSFAQAVTIGLDRESSNHLGTSTAKRDPAITPADRPRVHRSCGHTRSPRRAA